MTKVELMRKNTIGWDCIILVAISLLLTACATSSNAVLTSNSDSVIRIYSSLPDSGNLKAQTDTMVSAMKLAVEGVNSQAAGFKIEYLPLDDAVGTAGLTDAGQEAANAGKAASDPDAMVYIGAFDSDAAKVAIPILNKAGIVLLSPANSYPGFTQAVAGLTKDGEPGQYYPNGPRNYVQLVPNDDLEGPVDANYTATRLHAKSVYIVEDGRGYGVSLARAYEQAAPQNSLNVVGHASITDRAEDYQATSLKIKAATPDAIFYAGNEPEQAGKFLAEIRSANLKIPFLGSAGIQNDLFLKTIGPTARGVFSSIGLIDPANLPQKGQDFLKTYKAKYGDTVQPYTPYAYEAMSVALYAIKQVSKKDRLAILQAVASLKDFEGVLGKWSFEPDGDTTQRIYSFYTARNGSWVFDSNVNAGAE